MSHSPSKIFDQTNASKFGDTEAPTVAGEGDGELDDNDIIDMINQEDQIQEWSLPIKFIIKQKDFVIGKEFKKHEMIDIYVSQNTMDPGPDYWGGNQMHSKMNFNVKSKFNYDKEYGSNQVY